MRRSAALTVAAVMALALATAALAASTTLPLPRLVFDPGMAVSPKVLPKRDFAAAHATVSAEVETADGTHPSALREVVLDVERDVRVDARGYPVCEADSRGLRDPGRAREACRTSIVGSGKARFEIAFPERPPIVVESPVVVFNGGAEAGETKLYVHAVLTVPVPAAVVTEVRIRKRGGGFWAVARVPAVAGGAGSLLGLRFSFGRTVARDGRRVGLVEARCPDGRFEVSVSKAVFRNEARVPGVSAQTVMKSRVLVPCTPKG